MSWTQTEQRSCGDRLPGKEGPGVVGSGGVLYYYAAGVVSLDLRTVTQASVGRGWGESALSWSEVGPSPFDK